MQYTWDSRAAFEMAALPKAAAGHLKLASALHLRVLVWLCCVGQGRFEASACSVACGAAPELCEEALAYWVEQGLVVLEGMPPKALTATAPVLPASPPAEKEAPVSIPVTLPQSPLPASRPDRQEVLHVTATDERFAFLLETAASKLGKMLSPADMAVYLYLYRDVAMPPEVILMIIGYAVKNGKARLSYIEKTALNWAEDGITTIAAADAHLCHLEHCAEAWERVCRIGNVTIDRPTVKQKETACRWVYEWQMPDEVIEAAVAYTVEKTGKLQIPYADRLLEKLHEDGVTTAAAAKEALIPKKATSKPKHAARMKTAKDRPPSFDLGEYEELALRHRPQLPTQED